MDHLEVDLADAVGTWDSFGWPRPVAALVSGSGLSLDLGFERHGALSFDPFFPGAIEKVEGHPLEVELVEPVAGKPVLQFRGRLHAYQGYTVAETVYQVRLAALLGAHTIVFTNAAGGLDRAMQAGDLVVLTDHLNLTARNPLVHHPPEEWGPTFPDMSEPYDKCLREVFVEHAGRAGVPLRQGVYAGLLGPSYETVAEVRMLTLLGADVVGMSTVLEVIAARHMGLRCAGVSMVSNLAAGIAEHPLDHSEVLEAATLAASNLTSVLAGVLADERFLAG